jgi:glycosyltransferase 2 family protein
MRVGWRGLLGIALSGLLLWLTLRDVDLGEVVSILRTSHLGLWLACTVVATAIFPLRARRWQAILAPLAPRVPVRPLWHATAIGMMVNNVVPARAGEMARAFALSRARVEIPFAAALGSLVVDRLFDGTMVLGLLLLATLDPRFPTDATILGWTAGRIALGAGTLLGIVLVGILVLLLAPDLVTRLIGASAGRLSPRLAARLQAVMTSFAAGLAVLRSPALVGEVLWWTLLHWLTNAAAFWLGFLALGVDAPFSASLFLQGIIAIGVAIPSSPGFFGFFEAAGKAGLGLYGVPAGLAVSWAIGFHLLSFVPITVIGAWYFVRHHLHFRDMTAAGDAP